MSVIMGRHTPPGMCEDVKVIYLPQMGCLLAASNIHRRELIPPDWEQQFEAKGLTYFKTPQMTNLDEHYGDLQNIIIDLEIEWVQRLIERLEPLEWQLMNLGDAIAEVDCLLAFALAVERFGLVRPTMTEQPTLKIKNGWHPLYAMSLGPGQYIGNDTMLDAGPDPDMAAMTVITGANGSGKSAYGKQVALITYMAHIGSFVPADKATIGICDKIFTRVQTRESASKIASAFMIDLGQVSQALRGATSRSLIILDEFGKGTSPSDGAGLLAGVLTHLLNGANPRTVVLTHFHS
ncbi:P-loop containing nucleoside triphosphate hydrolase protein [Cutaneotrichosporon oleaginosum]|uniref:p-loop containing nucleoside triphosphate hydrolase protein n=1 Tax=Cutaneotrichosporon oleaginosum TaxID=879819 RepID=A0A0J0XL49_9TREE|nr:P-loop containing nucleoside triphosphate hydrolase protein [Cutaneotrichosporon oleaginosum]KLT41797.1 P-loop containing nucleoside triphosphate hydrolase protein [Cutaneotrichosporon oleaginosum]